MAKRIPLYPRIDYAKQLAKEFIIKLKIKSLPINPFAICSQCGYIVKSVSQTEKIIDEIDPFEVRDNPNCDAKTYLTSDGRYVIVYDDTVLSQGRIIWTIAHEIGHIVLKHLIQFEQTEINKGLTEKETEILEKEADAFASEFLSPAPILISCNCVKKKAIVKLCGLSDEAATYREEYLKNYKPEEKFQQLNEEIFKQFYNFINNKEFYININHKICPICKNYILSPRERYCRICGNQMTSKSLNKGIVYNDGPEISKRKNRIICYKCFKPHELQNGSICIYCGTTLINKCSNLACNKTHVVSSRYCFECGSPNTFLLEGVINDWQHTQKSIEKEKYIRQLLENHYETGRIFDEWYYLLKFIDEDGNRVLYNILKKSIAKIDYDTLFIYSESITVNQIISETTFTDYIIKLIELKLNISILEVLRLEINKDGIISFVA